MSDSSSPMIEACLSRSAFVILLSSTSFSASAFERLEESVEEIVPKAISTAINNSIIPFVLIGSTEVLYAGRRTFVWSFIDTLVFYRPTTQ